jgi:hypothetical protein
MSSIPALTSGVMGIQKGLDGLNRDAAQIASAKQLKNDSSTDLAEPLTNLVVDKQQVAVSAKVVKAADETLGTLLDVLA